ncbi:ATP-binding protein [Roseateles sp.]|uniref:hybrid sensor histidine kinase/response regulator n=1 Tax=Roseateles sp. TaxID=1971397 RepID=UPI0039EBA96C
MSADGRDRLSPLTRRYATRLCGLTLLLLLVSGVVEMGFSYRESMEHIERLQTVQADAAAHEISAYLTGIEGSLRDVAKLPWGERDFGPAERLQEFYRLMQAVPAIIELRAMDGAGREQLMVSRNAAARHGSGHTLADADALKATSQHPLLRGRTYFRDGHMPTMRVAAYDGQAAVVATVDLRLLGEIVTRLRPGDEGHAYIVDDADTLIAHSRGTEVLGGVDLSHLESIARARRAGETGARLAGLSTRNPRGQAVIVTASPVGETGWLVFVEQPRSEALSPALATLARTLALMGIGGLAALILGIAFARRMAAPIVSLRDATARIVAGQLDSALPARHKKHRHDEVEDLASDFGQMTLRLRELYASLEAKVAERTAQLSEARDVLAARADEIASLNQQLMSQLDELSLRKDEAERANAAKTRFLAAASHDLRQPMHSISLLIGVLRTRLGDPAHIDLADKVQSAVTTMENLFGNLLDISKLDAGTVHPHVEDVDLGWLLERAAHTWLPQAQEKGLSLRVRPCRWIVRGDATLLERIVGNLLANAIRYTRSGGVLVGCRHRGEHCELQVWDTGPGIAERHREAIFEEFFRIEAPGTGQEKGLGLGLSIVRRCVHILGYSIAVQSREGRGSVFQVRLPLAAGTAAPHAASATLGTPLQVLDGSFIVVVDDEATNREAVRDALLAAGCHVVVAANGEEALAQLEAHLRTPDLILTDFQLGTSGNGLDVIRRLRDHYDEAIPALVVTANTDARLPGQAAALGAGLLHKPVGLQRLLLALKDSLDAA